MAMTLRLTDELNEQLRQAAAEDDQSMQQTAVTAIAEYLKQRRARQLRAIFTGIAERDAGLLDRLGR